MDWVTVALVLSLMALGGLLVYWPMSIMLAHSQEKLRESLKRNIALLRASEGIVGTERLLDRGRDLPPDDELRLLLDPDAAQSPEAPQGPEGQHSDVASAERPERSGDAPV